MFEITGEAKLQTNKALAIIEEAEAVVIKTGAEYMVAQAMMKKVKARIKELGEIRKGQTRPLDDSKKKIMEFFQEPMKRLEDAKSKLNTAMVGWADEQERIRREEERRIQREAEEKALKAAAEAEAAGEDEKAEQIMKQEIEAKPVKVAPTIQTSRDSHIRETWSAEVVNLMDLVKAVAEGKVPIGAVCPDMKYLNTAARELRQALYIPGVRAVSKKTQI